MIVSPHKVDFAYVVSSGIFYLCDPQDVRASIARGYSGKGDAQNDPRTEKRTAEGPIPRGLWKIRPSIHHARLGRLALPLEPVGHSAHGRSGFYIHGDNRDGNGTASTGCIILDPWTRQLIDTVARSAGKFVPLIVE